MRCLSAILCLAAAAAASIPPRAVQAGDPLPAVSFPQAVDAENVWLEGHWAGSIGKVIVQDGLAYVGEGPQFTILDVSHPESPAILGKFDFFSQGLEVESFAVRDGYAYLLVDALEKGFWVVNVADPGAPEIGDFVRIAGNAEIFLADGSLLYLALNYGGSGSLRMMDISDPAAPANAGYITTRGEITSLAVSGGYVYLTQQFTTDGTEAGLLVVDVSDPAAPVMAGDFNLPGARSVAVEGGYLYLTDSSGLRVFDISDPAVPEETGILTMSYRCVLSADGGYAYVAGCNGMGMWVVDIRDPAAPVEAGYLDVLMSGVVLDGGYAYVRETAVGLRIMDVRDPADLRTVGIYPTPHPQGVAVVGGYAYVVDNDLVTVDIGNPDLPRPLGLFDLPQEARGVAVEGGYAYLADTTTVLRVVDIRDPSSPAEAGVFDPPGGGPSGQTVVRDGYVFVADPIKGLWVIDVRDPAAPQKAGVFPLEGAERVALSGGYAYVTTESGLRVIDIRNPAAPVQAGGYDVPFASGAAVDGDYLYLTENTDDGALHVLDIRDPAAPVEVGYRHFPFATNVAVSGGYLYLISYDSQEGVFNLWVLDIGDPAAPAEAGRYLGFLHDVHDLAVAGKDIFIAGGYSGLFILRFSEEGETAGPVASAEPSRTPAAVLTETGFPRLPTITCTAAPSQPPPQDGGYPSAGMLLMAAVGCLGMGSLGGAIVLFLMWRSGRKAKAGR